METKAGTTDFASVAIVYAIEFLEDVTKFFSGYADTGVGYDDFDSVLVSGDGCADGARGGVFDGIFNDVADDFAQEVDINLGIDELVDAFAISRLGLRVGVKVEFETFVGNDG